MNEYNLIWIIVDSVRSYKTGLDDRDRLDVMDKFGQECVELTNAFTSAPSSALSASTMFTGVSACFISRHFNDWEFDERKIHSVQNTLKSRGYALYTIHDSREGRLLMRKLIHPLSAKYFPKGISHNNWWTNKEITNILRHVLESDAQLSPAFYLLWYDCRRDQTTSDEVARALALFKEHGLYENSVILMCSDHGYPDPATGLTEETMKKFTHDMIVTNDNIKVPLLLKYPNCPKGLKIDEEVGTIDLFPTICNIMGIPLQNQKFKYKGKSLLGLIDRTDLKPRIVRTDTRLNAASGRVTALTSNGYKYVYYWDQHIEELYNFVEDCYEIKNLLAQNVSTDLDMVVRHFRQTKDDMEKQINTYHISDLGRNFAKNINKIKSNIECEKVYRVLLVSKNAPEMMIGCLLDLARKTFPNSEIDLLVNERDFLDYKEVSFDTVYSLKVLNVAEASKSGIMEKQYDMTLYLTEQSRQCFIEKRMIRIIKGLKTKRSYMLDYNFKLYNRFMSNWYWPIKNYIIRSSNTCFYKEEPMLIFKDAIFIAKMLLVAAIKRKKDLVDADKVKKMRDRDMVLNTKKACQE